MCIIRGGGLGFSCGFLVVGGLGGGFSFRFCFVGNVSVGSCTFRCITRKSRR